MSLTGRFPPRVVLPGSDRVVVSGTLDGTPKAGIFCLNAAADADYVQLLDGGVSHMVRIPYILNATPQAIPLPLRGTILEVATAQREAGAFVNLTSWTARGDVFRYDARTNTTRALDVVPSPHWPRRAVDELSATSADGTPVPVSVVYEKGAPRDGTRSVMLTVIGAYGFSTTPDFDRVPQAWLDLGGMYAVAHVRGGGEFGEAWHRAGMGSHKSATWTDLIAAAQLLIGSRYTAARSLDLYGGVQSYLGGIAAGIAIGRALEERPDLFAAAVLTAPAPDMLRSETTTFGSYSASEFGTSSTPDGFAALDAMSPYEHVPGGTTLPPMLIWWDDLYGKGADWQAAKFVARLQAASPMNRAYLARVLQDGRLAEDADTYAFFLSSNSAR